ncbi:hypothetical protein, partial [uncultured Succinatimonas sp.]|uniref:hypothetical protein n=1 Tax=uncultured Succinatimonas sp. TaxID=1262973 RepID=UPI0025E23E8F
APLPLQPQVKVTSKLNIAGFILPRFSIPLFFNKLTFGSFTTPASGESYQQVKHSWIYFAAFQYSFIFQ